MDGDTRAAPGPSVPRTGLGGGPASRAPARLYADFPAAGAHSRPLPADVITDDGSGGDGGGGAASGDGDGDGGIALLRLTGTPPVPPAVLHRQTPAPGEPVRLVGYPAERPGGREVPARILGRDTESDRPGWVRLDTGAAQARHGFGGGGVVHARTGRIIGVLAPSDRPDGPVRMIPTETLLRRLPAAGRERMVAGPRAVSHTIPLTPGPPGPHRSPGLRRTVAGWLDGGDPSGRTPRPGARAGSAEAVELVFAEDGDDDALAAIHETLNLADRERDSRTPGRSAVPGPPAGSIDLAVEATGRTVAELVAHAAGRAGLDDGTTAAGDDTQALLERIAGEGPPLAAAFVSVDRLAPRAEDVLPLLRALLSRGRSRVLLAFRDPASPLLERVADELLDGAWAERRADAVAARLELLASRERRFHRAERGRTDRHTVRLAPPASRRFAARLERLRGETSSRTSAALAYELSRLRTDVEDSLVSWEPAGPHRRYVVLPAGGGLTDLPHVTVGDPDDLVESDPSPAPVPDSGLDRGQELNQQYRVIGRLGRGSFGQVYLARDQLLEDRAVALKGVLDPGDPRAAETALRERLRLVGLNHPSIIKVFNYARHPAHPGNTAMFIVMEFADGAPLSWVADQIADRVPPFDDQRVHEFIAAYGLRVLEALTYLHVELGLVYGDLSLTNVMHCGDGIKLIDVAGVRRIGAAGPVTHPAPETRYGRVTVAADLYAVGVVLRHLFAMVPGEPGAAAEPSATGPTPLERVIVRATAAEPEQRFATAAEMALQLRGVLRELRSRRLGVETFEPSPLFAPAPAALDGELGKAPPLAQWRSGGTRKRRLTAPPPTPAEVALGLPVPLPAAADANWTKLQRTSYDDPAGLLQLSSAWGDSPERSLLRCRLHLELAGDHPAAGRAAECDAAGAELDRAGTAVGALAAHDWRLHWHRGLLRLVQGRVGDARDCFETVYAAIPGEYAPKLALGYCHEKLDRTDRAGQLYDAVWQRNRALGGAAFGLARIHLAAGRPQEALDRLGAVPADSRHRTAARTAMVRILADPPPDGGPPDPAAVSRAWVALDRLSRKEGLTDRHAQERLRTDLLELLLHLAAPQRTAPGAGDPLGALHAELAGLPEPVPAPRSERELREDLAACYLRLFEQVPLVSGDGHQELAEALVDNAYDTRPVGFRHHRRGERRHRLFGGRSAGRAGDPGGTTPANGRP
ncbi:tetratricopeptide repeat protein [Streptomyces yaizuensis]|uniref:Trypsin-like peptidase domain-containing protein n=1 Tax=Streptomyces yaizuensis TaxID=2989713 RepID=A0ABQ5NT65_9ACTN|nr:tetratricopeptide repeat protein [Streptomyces sp. YSPA8]GLF93201.1 trypsin-like peptidase domain-containing protein [Streptomyces sp. YSPA8]